jgi:hypothetical protein
VCVCEIEHTSACFLFYSICRHTLTSFSFTPSYRTSLFFIYQPLTTFTDTTMFKSTVLLILAFATTISNGAPAIFCLTVYEHSWKGRRYRACEALRFKPCPHYRSAAVDLTVGILSSEFLNIGTCYDGFIITLYSESYLLRRYD